jgi:Spy/CpxP family protein refolding chaperone
VVTIVVDAAGVATATSSAALTAAYDATATRPTPPAGEKHGKGGKGGKGKGGHGPKF